ncbi:MAG TPA: SAM-dependent DNA methyltransferase [Pilimelia sp.]|nr:SAM-dependent DNA methyltransferase [Pilimelia sp.]
MVRRVHSRTEPERDHQDWQALVAVSGPFLTLPVLTRVWPSLESIDPAWWAMMRVARADGDVDPDLWIEFLLRRFCGWGDLLRRDGMGLLRQVIPEYHTSVEPDFVLVDPTTDIPRLLGMTLKPGRHPAARATADAWPATPVDRVARLCRHHRVPLGLVTDGRWFALVVAPPGSATSTAVFDTATWPEAADRVVIRAFYSFLERRRFFAVPDDETLPALVREGLDRQAEVTGVLGDQVRRAVEMLVGAIGWDDLRAQRHGRSSLTTVSAHDVYRAATIMVMRVVFLLYAEERGLLPADNDLFARSYSVRRLGEELERRRQESSEEDLEQSRSAWLRILALCDAIHCGVRHERLSLPTYDGPMFDPTTHPWLSQIWVDDRTVLHMLHAVQYVQLGRESRRLSFRALGVEQIGHVYEQLLAFDARRASDIVVALQWGRRGSTAEVRLAELERHDRPPRSAQERAAALARAYGEKATGSIRVLAKRLTPPQGPALVEALRLLYSATGGDRDLTDRLLPYVGVLRRDLRGLPMVIPEGGLYVTASATRANTGTLYTPADFAAEVASGALEDLVYRPGPAQTSDRSRWRVRSSAELLALRVADIAVGSGAFLTAACRYLARRLVEAWAAEGDARARELVERIERDGPPDDVEADPLTIRARRAVIQRCLFGADIDPMAVEIAKLSLWLISLDPAKPFTFLDHHLVAGDSLLGVTSLAQVEELHLDPAAGRALRDRWLGDPGRGVRELVAQVARIRRELADQADDTLPDVQWKDRRWREAQERSATARLIADLVVGAALHNAGQPDRRLNRDVVATAHLAHRITTGSPGAVDDARELADRWLSADLPAGDAPRTPLHWPLVFADVFEQGGFDAVVGNQPYLGGQKITGTLGLRYRELLVRWLGGGARGSADLVAYFVLRSHEVLTDEGVTGLIATNTLWQGDTRDVALARLLARGVTIRRATKSRPWPTPSAVLQVCQVKTAMRPASSDAVCELDGAAVSGVTASLDARSRVGGSPARLAANRATAFQGSIILGQGFTMEPEPARQLIENDPRNADVLFPYLNGKDLNSRPDCSASRWVINFHDWPQARAATYPDCYRVAERLVKPERAGNHRRSYRGCWWIYAERRPALVRALAKLDRVSVITLVSKIVMPVMVPTGQVFSHMLGVFATDDAAMLGLLSSAAHYWWAIERSSTLETRVRYTPSDVFETFARPELTGGLRRLGERLDTYRRELMLARQAGLTATYNLVHDKGAHDEDIAGLRRIHVDIDHEVMRAYGWTDLALDHDFHDTRQGTRFTVGPVARQEMLDRLLELNHARHAEEQRRDDRPRQLRLDEDGGDPPPSRR